MLALFYTNFEEKPVAGVDGDGIPNDDVEAASWMLKAAKQGYVHAQTSMGGHYAYGTGVKQDYREALKWYHKAA